jgi:hypothetical protein
LSARRELCLYVREKKARAKTEKEKRQRNVSGAAQTAAEVEMLSLRKTVRIAIKSIKEALLVTRQSFG